MPSLPPGYPDDEYPNYPEYPEYDVTPGSPTSPLAYVGPAEILSGPFTLHGVGHKVKYTSGHFQHSAFHNVTVSADTQSKPRLGDDVYKVGSTGFVFKFENVSYILVLQNRDLSASDVKILHQTLLKHT